MDNKTTDDTLLIPEFSKGDKLYHYTSASGLKGICEEGFWVTECGFLNDSMEYKVASEVFGEVLDSHMHNKELCSRIQEKVKAEVERLQSTSLSVNEEIAYGGDYIISFCKDYDSPIMWSSYSNYFGYCVQFDAEKLLSSFKGNRNYGFLHGEVIYDYNQQIKLIENTIINDYFNNKQGFDYLNNWEDFDKITEENIEDLYWILATDVSAYNMFFKLPCFEGEHEYRFVFMVGHDGGRYKKDQLFKQFFKIKDEVLIPYIKVPLNSLDSIERVAVGSKNKSDIAVKGVKYLFRNLKHDIDVEKSCVPLRY